MTDKVVPDRSKITMDAPDVVRYWTKHLGVNKKELTAAIEKVGNSAAAVRKELAARGSLAPSRSETASE